MNRYVQNLESGLTEAWNRYLKGLPPDHIEIIESEEARRGTYDDVLEANPSDRVSASHEEL